MISIGVNEGGPELADSQIEKLLMIAMRVAASKRQPDYKSGASGWVNVVFMVPGTVSKPDFQGYKLGHFSKKEKGLVVQIAVPQPLTAGNGTAAFIVEALREAVRMAAAHFKTKEISFSTLRAEKAILSIEAAL